jgi:acetyl esterase/lipase
VNSAKPAGRHQGDGQQPYELELQRMHERRTSPILGTFLIGDLLERRALEASPEYGWQDSHPGILHHEISLDRAGSSIRMSLFQRARGEGAARHPAIYFIHGGGMMVGDRLSRIELALDWVEAFDAVCLSVGYRLAPEHPDPAPIEDCYAGLVWLFENADDWNIDPDRIIVCGVSAGGGLAAGTTLLARDRHTPPVMGQVLVSPMLDDRNDTPSAHQFADNDFWDHASNATGWRALLGSRAGGSGVSAHAAPARARDVLDLPPTILDVGSMELFRDEDVDYASRLMAAGVSVELHVWQGGFHEFDATYPTAAMSMAAAAVRTAWVGRLLSNP